MINQIMEKDIIDIQIEEIKKNGYENTDFSAIENDVLRELIMEDFTVLKFIENPSDKLCSLVFHKTEAMKYIKNPSIETCLTFMKYDLTVLKYIDLTRFTDEQINNMCMETLNGYTNILGIKKIIKHVKNPSYELLKKCVKKYPACIGYIPNPSEELCMMVIKEEPFYISDIVDPTEEIKIYAVSINPGSIVEIKNPGQECINVAREGLYEFLQDLFRNKNYEEQYFEMIICAGLQQEFIEKTMILFNDYFINGNDDLELKDDLFYILDTLGSMMNRGVVERKDDDDDE